jgi:tRNA threonylcarbamoyladenosine biosynthesis protein TsaE
VILDIITSGPMETHALGKLIGKRVDKAILIALTGDLGSGKTVFVQGLARGLDVPEAYYITSPTFTLVNEYPGRLILCHVDLYRLDPSPHANEEIEDIGLYEMMHGKGVVAVEWAERLTADLPPARIMVKINIIGHKQRKFSFRSHGSDANRLLQHVKILTN